MKRVFLMAVLVALLVPASAGASGHALSHERALAAIEKRYAGEAHCRRQSDARFLCRTYLPLALVDEGRQVPYGEIRCTVGVAQYERLRLRGERCAWVVFRDGGYELARR